MKYEKDQIIEEIHDVRKAIFNEFNRDPHELGKFLMEMDRNRKGLQQKKRKVPHLVHA